MCQKLYTAGCWIFPAIIKRRQESGRDGVTQDAAHEELCWAFPLYRPSRSLEQFRTQGLESTAGQRCARKSTEFASGAKVVGDDRGEMGISLVTQDATHKGFCWTFPLYRPSRSLKQFRTLGFLRIESTVVQRCARKSTEFASGSKIVRHNRGEMGNFLVTQDYTHRGFC